MLVKTYLFSVLFENWAKIKFVAFHPGRIFSFYIGPRLAKIDSGGGDFQCTEFPKNMKKLFTTSLKK